MCGCRYWREIYSCSKKSSAVRHDSSYKEQYLYFSVTSHRSPANSTIPLLYFSLSSYHSVPFLSPGNQRTYKLFLLHLVKHWEYYVTQLLLEPRSKHSTKPALVHASHLSRTLLPWLLCLLSFFPWPDIWRLLPLSLTLQNLLAFLFCLFSPHSLPLPLALLYQHCFPVCLSAL